MYQLPSFLPDSNLFPMPPGPGGDGTSGPSQFPDFVSSLQNLQGAQFQGPLPSWQMPSSTQTQSQPQGGSSDAFWLGQGFQPYNTPSTASMSYGQSTRTPSASDQWLAGLNGNMSYLQGWAQNPRPIDQLPAWQATRDAQQRNIAENAGNLNEYFNTMGGRFSTSFGNAMTDYYSQTAKDQNALLANMQAQAMEQAMGRQYGAASQLGQYAFQGPALLSQQNNALEMQDRGFGFNAAMYNAQQADQAAQALANASMFGANALNSGASNAALGLYGTENQAANSLFNSQINSLPIGMQYLLSQQGLNLGAAQNASSSYLANLGLGSNMGGQQYGTLQDQINRSYQEFIRTSPQYNPWVQMMQQLAMAQAGMYFPQYSQPGLSQISGLLGGLGGLFMGLG